MTLINLSMFDQIGQVSQDAVAIDAASLYKAFEQVKDTRKKKGKRYPLALLLTLILLGKMAGQTTIAGTIHWISLRKKQIQQLLNWPRDFPSHWAYMNALVHCDDQELVQVLAQVILKARAVEQCGPEPSRLLAQKEQGEENLLHTAMDGKTMRGTLKHGRDDQPPVHLLSLYECVAGIVLAHVSVKKKENEITAMPTLLHPSLVKGRIITADAMHTQKKFCTLVSSSGGYYLLIAKENQPGVLADLADFFNDKELDQGEWQYHKEVNKGHGRLEVREIWASTQMNEWFERDWTGIAQIFLIRRTITEKSETRVETVYGITSLPRKKANAKRLLELNRKHWSIENRLHYRRDVTLGEDAGQVRTKGAPQVIAALNGGFLALMDFLGVNNVAKQLRYYCAYPQEALQLLLGRLSRRSG
jgi:predicted transposase YbfD/YdcC